MINKKDVIRMRIPFPNIQAQLFFVIFHRINVIYEDRSVSPYDALFSYFITFISRMKSNFKVYKQALPLFPVLKSVFVSPFTHPVQYRDQRFPALCEAVFHLWRDLRIFFSVYELIRFQFF